MSGKNSNAPLVIGGLALLVAIIGAVTYFLFSEAPSDEDGPAPKGLPIVESALQPKPNIPKPIIETNPVKIETSKFDAGRDPDGASTAIEGDVTGLRVQGKITSPTGMPLENAEVILIRDVSAIRTRPQDGEVLARVKTSKNGNYIIENLAAGDLYVIQASHSDFTSERRHPIDPSLPASLQQDIQLQLGIEIAGKVTDSNGQSIEGAEIRVVDMTIQTLDPVQPPERTAKTGADGTYAIRHLVAGMKSVRAHKDGFSTDGRNALDVRAGQPLNEINFSLNQGFVIAGRVIDSNTNRPIPGAVITGRPVSFLGKSAMPQGADAPIAEPQEIIERDPSEGVKRVENDEVARKRWLAAQESVRHQSIAQKTFLLETASTDEQGTFLLIGLMEARYMLQIRAPGYQPNNAFPADAGSEGHTIALTPSPRITGRLIDDETGEPVKAFRLAATPNRDAPFIPAQSWQRFKSENGEFDYTDVRPGLQYLVAEADGYATGKSDGMQVIGDQSLSGIVVRIARGATLKGMVRDSAGAPVAGVRVDLVPGTGSASGGVPENPFTRILETQMRSNTRKRGVTNKNGEWTMPNVLAGTYKVKTDHAEYSEAETTDFTCESRGEFKVPDLQVKIGAIISGVVKKKVGEEFDARATVMISGADPTAHFFSRSVPTTADGRFELRGLKAGSYKVMVTQREGVFDLLAVLQKGQDPQSVITIQDGQKIELTL